MAKMTSWNLNMQVIGGPSSNASGSLNVDAIDKLDIVVPKATDGKAGTILIEVQPGSPSSMQFLFITSSHYSSLKCIADPNVDPEKSGPSIPLEYPLMLLGGGFLTLLKFNQAIFRFENGSDNEAFVTIMIGRSAQSPA
jgi:hypothetical protein